MKDYDAEAWPAPRQLERRRLTQRVTEAVVACVGITVLGAAGYVVLEDVNVLDAIYMSVIVVSTVGLEEVKEFGPLGRGLTIVLTMVGVGTFMYMVSAVGTYVIAGELRGALGQRRMLKKIDQLRDHVIVCGAGRMGSQVAREFRREGLDVVVVEQETVGAERAAERGFLVVEGDAGSNEVLRRAGVERARCLVTSVDDDATNLFVVLSARELNERLFIVARANVEATEAKLQKAGADRVLWPYGISGRRMAQMALRPNVVEFLEVVMHDEELELWMEECAVAAGSALEGAEIGSDSVREQAGATILALRHVSGRMLPGPTPETRLNVGDVIVAIGTRAQVAALRRLAANGAVPASSGTKG